MPTCTINRDPEVLAELAAADGAILHWQVDRIDHLGEGVVEAFASAHKRGIIRFDDTTDCYVHPNAIAINNNAEANGYKMSDV